MNMPKKILFYCMLTGLFAHSLHASDQAPLELTSLREKATSSSACTHQWTACLAVKAYLTADDRFAPINMCCAQGRLKESTVTMLESVTFHQDPEKTPYLMKCKEWRSRTACARYQELLDNIQPLYKQLRENNFKDEVVAQQLLDFLIDHAMH